MGFIPWALFGILSIVLGIYCMNSKKESAFGFWANTDVAPIDESKIKDYNKALGKLWCGFGFFFILLGLPLLGEQNSPLIIIPGIGVSIEVIIAMAIYTIKIEGKYRKK